MDEYIKREDAIKAIIWNGIVEPPEIIPLTLLAAQRNIRRISASDVVPKSEVEELNRECESLGKTVNEASELIRKLKGKVEEAKTEVAREIFEEIYTALRRSKNYDMRSGTYFECYLEGYIAELKKKYTEEKK